MKDIDIIRMEEEQFSQYLADKAESFRRSGRSSLPLTHTEAMRYLIQLHNDLTSFLLDPAPMDKEMRSSFRYAAAEARQAYSLKCPWLALGNVMVEGLKIYPAEPELLVTV